MKASGFHIELPFLLCLYVHLPRTTANFSIALQSFIARLSHAKSTDDSPTIDASSTTSCDPALCQEGNSAS